MSDLISTKENKYEKVVLSYLLKDEIFIKKALSLNIKRDWFSDSELKSFFEIIISYYLKFESVLTRNVYMDIIRSTKGIDSSEHYAYFSFYDLIENSYKDEKSFEFYLSEFKDDSIFKRSLSAFRQYITDHDKGHKDNNNLVNDLVKNLNKIRFQTEGKKYDIIDYMDDIDKQVEDLRNRKDHPELYSGIKTYIPSIDKYFNGFERGTLAVIAAMTGTGKSTLMKEFARRQCVQGRKNVLIISCEDYMMIWAHKVTSSELKIPLSNLLRGDITEEQLQSIIEFKNNRNEVGGYKIVELPARSFTVPEIEMIIEQYSDEWKPDIVYVDQISLILPVTFKGERIDAEYGEISKMLRAMAKKLNIPIVAASQVNRKSVKEKKGERHVDINTENLSQSDEISQDSDSIFAIQLDNVDDTACTLKLLKQRNGPTNINVQLYFHKTFCCFLDKEFEVIQDTNNLETVCVGKDSIKTQIEEMLKTRENLDDIINVGNTQNFQNIENVQYNNFVNTVPLSNFEQDPAIESLGQILGNFGL